MASPLVTPTPFLNKVKLIKAVAERKILWDQKSEHYFNRDLSKVAWDHVAADVGSTSEICKKKWRGLRDTFIKEFRKVTKEPNKPSNWRYYNKLIFLTDQIRHTQETSDPIEINYSLEEYAQLMNEPHEEDIKREPDFSMEEDTKNHVLTDDENSSYEPEIKRIRREETFDSDYHFLMSLLESFRNIHPKRKNLVKIKILNILCEEENDVHK